MKGKRVFQGVSLEETATFLAKEIRRQYTEILEVFREQSVDDLEEYRWVEEHLKTDPSIIEQETHDMILEIAKNPKKYRSFYKKWRLIRSKDIISIKGNGEFFSRSEFNLAVGMNVEYLVNIKKFIVVRCYYLLNEKYPN